MSCINIRDIIIDSEKTAVCVPITGINADEIHSQMLEALKHSPDIIEWRCDCLNSVKREDVETILPMIRRIAGNIAVLFTFRTSNEGGNKMINDNDYYDVNILAASTGCVDIIDVEACSRSHLAKELIRDLQDMDVKVLGSCHDFVKTPKKEKMDDIFETLHSLGSDIIKLAVMPKCEEDVDALMKASRRAYYKFNCPVVSMSMAQTGVVSRIRTDVSKSAITFASVGKASAPGQVEIETLRKLMKINKHTQRDKNIVLTGFMGSGKTTVSKMLSKLTGMIEIDTDSYIEANNECTISEIFEKSGEKGFREIETEAIKEISNQKGIIISCGGGVVLKKENVDYLKRNGIIVYLDADCDTIYNRVKNDTGRPLLKDKMTKEYIQSMMDQRSRFYNEALDFSVDAAKDCLSVCCDIIDVCGIE